MFSTSNLKFEYAIPFSEQTPHQMALSTALNSELRHMRQVALSQLLNINVVDDILLEEVVQREVGGEITPGMNDGKPGFRQNLHQVLYRCSRQSFPEIIQPGPACDAVHIRENLPLG